MSKPSQVLAGGKRLHLPCYPQRQHEDQRVELQGTSSQENKENFLVNFPSRRALQIRFPRMSTHQKCSKGCCCGGQGKADRTSRVIQEPTSLSNGPQAVQPLTVGAVVPRAQAKGLSRGQRQCCRWQQEGPAGHMRLGRKAMTD